MITGLQYVGFTSPAAEEWRTFGPEVLGCELAADGPDGAARLRLDDAGYRIAVHPGEADGLAYMGWGVAGPAEMVALAARLTDAGVKVADGTPELMAERQVRGLISFTDPVGLRHEAAWGQLVVPSSFRPGRAISGFVTGDGGLGHVVLIVPDIEREERFITELLGFHLSDHIEMGPMNFRFYHCNPRHHTFAMAPIPGLIGIHHLMVEVGSIDDVGTGLEIVNERGHGLAMSLGRHVNDLMTSFYVRGPSGFEIEYGTGGLLVEPGQWKAASFDRISTWGHHPPAEALPPGAAVTAYTDAAGA
jgi:extradiol dioxygenase